MEKYVSPSIEPLDLIESCAVMIASPAPGGIEGVDFEDWDFNPGGNEGVGYDEW